jgi:hypothetical protein
MTRQSSRLFHTLVVVGAGLAAAHCGGESVTHGEKDDAGSAGGPQPTGGRGGAGGTTGGNVGAGQGGITSTTGGSSGAGSGGVIALSGGTGVGAAGGAAGAGGSEIPPDASVTAQWDCRGLVTSCDYTSGLLAGYGYGVQVAESCAVDPSRPRGPDDCEPGAQFLCQLAVTARGSQFPVNCECVVDDSNCGPCMSLSSGNRVSAIRCDEGVTLCPCAFTGILK